MTAPFAQTLLGVDRSCSICSCTDLDACVDPDGTPCAWVFDDLCSACADKQSAAIEAAIRAANATSDLLNFGQGDTHLDDLRLLGTADNLLTAARAALEIEGDQAIADKANLIITRLRLISALTEYLELRDG